MTYEELPPSQLPPDGGEFSATPEEWAQLSARIEEILGGLDGKKISQQTWTPGDVYQPAFDYTVNYAGTTMILKRVGQTEPTIDTEYTLECINRNLNFQFSVQPYLEKPVAILRGDQPRLEPEDELPARRLDMLKEYLNTYTGEAHG